MCVCVPLFPVDQRVVKLSLKSRETGHEFISTQFIYYNCSVLQS